MAKVIKEVIHANGIDIGIYTEDFQNEYISLAYVQEICLGVNCGGIRLALIASV